MPLLAILGKTPSPSLAELECIYGSDAIKRAGYEAAVIDINKDELHLERLGGTQKAGEILSVLPNANWQEIRKHLQKKILDYVSANKGSKIKFGISAYNFGIKAAEINATSLSIKKSLKDLGFSARIIANKSNELNSAQVTHGGLLSSSGTELIILRDEHKTIIAKTLQVQNIDAYAARDQARPMRDSRVGMLPPKLAQIIINLAGNRLDLNHNIPTNNHNAANLKTDFQSSASLLLDPFCGTGVLMQEALLMGYRVKGSDIEPRMVEYSQKNLEWLEKTHKLKGAEFHVEAADATSHKWSQFDIIACETYLGRPMVSLPDAETLRKIISDCNMIHKKFLQNVARQTKPGFRMCIAVPAWRTKNSFLHLPVLDFIEDLGYNRMSFVHSEASKLLYYREDQTVARELVVLIRK